MKMRRFGCLLYRELYLSRKSLILNGIVALSMMLLGILVLLSARYGNLTLVPEEHKEAVGEITFVFAAILPVYACVMVAMSLVESWQYESDRKWRLFRKTTPVRGSEYVLVKYVLLFAAMGLAIPLSSLYMWCSGLIMGTNETGMNIQCVLVMLFAFICFSQVFQIFALLFESMDRAGIAFAIVITVLMFLGMEFMERSGKMLPIGEEMMINDLFARFAGYLPQVTIVFLVTTVVSFFLTVKLYERREK